MQIFKGEKLKGTFILGYKPLSGGKNQRFFCVCDYLLLTLRRYYKLFYKLYVAK